MKKKILVITLSVLLVLSVLFALYKAGKLPFIPTLQSSAIPDTTGAIEETPVPAEEKYLDQFASLQDKTPVIQNGFTIDFDYAENSFKVVIKNPYNTNLQVFLTWLKDNGYNLIPLNKFMISEE